MRIRKLRTFGSMREFVVYDSVEDFLSCGREKEELVYWDFLPRYFRKRGNDIPDVLAALERLEISTKMLVTSDHHVIPVVGVKKQTNRQRKLIALYLDTAYGRFELKYGYYCKEGKGKQVQYQHQSLVANIAACNDFWAGFAMSYPVQWAKLEHNPVKAITWLKTRYIVNQEFFERLRREMSDDKYLMIVEQMLPTAEAKKAAIDCMTQSEDLKVKSTTALGVMNIAVEVMKLMEDPLEKSNGKKQASAPFPLPGDNVPQPYTPVGTKKG